MLSSRTFIVAYRITYSFDDTIRLRFDANIPQRTWVPVRVPTVGKLERTRTCLSLTLSSSRFTSRDRLHRSASTTASSKSLLATEPSPTTITTTPPLSPGGLTTGANIGLGVGVPLIVIALAALGWFIFWTIKKQSKPSATSEPSDIFVPVEKSPAYTQDQAHPPLGRQGLSSWVPPGRHEVSGAGAWFDRDVGGVWMEGMSD